MNPRTRCSDLQVSLLYYTFCCSFRENTHLFVLRGEQLRGNTIIRDKKPPFERKSDSLTIFAF